MWTKLALAINLILSCLLLLSILLIDDHATLFALTALFFLFSLILKFRTLNVVALFFFLWPLLPSEPHQYGLPRLNFYEYFLVSIVFWWSLKKLLFTKSQNSLVDSPRYNLRGLGPFFVLFLIFSFVSCVAALLSHHLITTRLFVMNLLAQGTVFHPWDNSWLSLRLWLDLLEGIWLFIIIVDAVKEQEDFELLYKVWVASAAVVALIGIVQYLTRYGLLPYWIEQNPNLTRINSTFSDPNSLATYLGASFFLAVAKFSISKKNLWMYFLTSSLIGVSLIMTFSRVALASVFVLFFLFPSIFRMFTRVNLRDHTRGIIRWSYQWGFVSVVILALLIVTATLINFYVDRPQSLVDVVLTTVNTRVPLVDTLKGRPGFWTAAAQMFADKPWFGHGLGSFPTLSSRFPYSSFTGGVTENAHNYYLQLIAERGLFGISLFLFPIILILQRVFVAARSLNHKELLYFYGLLVSLFVILMTSLTGHPLMLLKLQIAFFSLLALLFFAIKSLPRLPYRFTVFLSTAVLLVAIPFQIKAGLENRRLTVYEYGYHAAEKDSDGSLFHWTGEKGVSLLRVQGKTLKLKLRQLNPEVIKKPIEVKILINDSVIDNVTFTSFDPVELQYYLPGTVPHEWIRLTIQPSTTFRGKEYGSQDVRKLGVIVYSFNWNCALTSSIGFFEAEQNNREPFLWSRKQASLYLKPESRTFTLPILPNPAVEQNPLEVDFYWKIILKLHRIETGECNIIDHAIIDQDFDFYRFFDPAVTILLTERKWRNVTLRIPEDKRTSGVLTFRVSKTWNPHKMKTSADTRDLGIAVGKPVWSMGYSGRRNQSVSALAAPFTTWSLSKGDELFEVSVHDITQVRVPRVLNVFKNLDKTPVRQFTDSAAAVFTKEAVLYSQLPGFVLQSKPWSHRTEKLTGSISIRFVARAYFIDSEAPVVALSLNGKQIAQHVVRDEGWREYITQLSVPSGSYELTLSVLNGVYVKQNKDFRTVYVEKLSVLSSDHQTHSASAVIDAGMMLSPAAEQVIYSNVTERAAEGPLQFQFTFQPGLYYIRLQAKGNQPTLVDVYLSEGKFGTFKIDSTKTMKYETELFAMKILVVKKVRIVPHSANAIHVEEIRVVRNPSVIIFDPVTSVTPTIENCFFLKEIY